MSWEIRQGDALEQLRLMPAESVHCCVTSPPYWGLRDYGVSGQLGLEETPELYVSKMTKVFRDVRRVLRSDGTLWLNIGDSYTAGGRGGGGSFADERPGWDGVPMEFGKKRGIPGLKPKDLCGVPWLLAFALRKDGWFLRQDIIWSKPNPMPESITDRCTKSHEYLFLLSRDSRYYFDQAAILEDCSPNTHARLAQDVESQIGSERANGGQKTNGNMKAVRRKGDETPRNDGERWNSNNGRGFERKSLPETQVRLGEYRDNQRKLAAAGSGIKSNESFSNAVCCLVEKRNKRSVWEVSTQGYSEAHFATFPPKLIEPCILAGCPEYTCSACGNVLDSQIARAITNGIQMSALRNKIRSAAEPEDQDALLQQGLYGKAQNSQTSDGEMRNVREASSSRSTRQAAAVLQQGMRGETHGENQEYDEGQIYNGEGLRSDLRARAPERFIGGICNGASSRDGEGVGEVLAAIGGGTPQEREEGRQSPGEPTGDGQEASRRDSKAEARRTDRMPTLLQSDHSVPRCESCEADLTSRGAITGGTVLDPFAGAGTTGLVSTRLGRNFIGIELNPEYVRMAEQRITQDAPLFNSVSPLSEEDRGGKGINQA